MTFLFMWFVWFVDNQKATRTTPNAAFVFFVYLAANLNRLTASPWRATYFAGGQPSNLPALAMVSLC
jgi:hypothetical protein